MRQPKTVSSASPEDYELVAAFAYENVGLVLGPGKMAMLRSRLRHRLQALQLTSVAEYFRYAQRTNCLEEHGHIVSALTTNVSSFFREKHHFEVLDKLVWPQMRENARHGSKIRIWSAGCSYGQEPLSIAMSLTDHSPTFDQDNVQIFATDIDEYVLNKAKSAEFDASNFKDIPRRTVQRHFRSCSTMNGEKYFPNCTLKSLIKYRPANLIKDHPASRLYDVIFCRNVMIYFDKPTQSVVLGNLVRGLKKGGYLFVGHAERADHPDLSPLGGTVYIRKN